MSRVSQHLVISASPAWNILPFHRPRLRSGRLGVTVFAKTVSANVRLDNHCDVVSGAHFQQSCIGIHPLQHAKTSKELRVSLPSIQTVFIVTSHFRCYKLHLKVLPRHYREGKSFSNSKGEKRPSYYRIQYARL